MCVCVCRSSADCNVGKGKVSSGPNVPVTFNNYMEDKHVPPMSTNERRVIIPAGNTHCNQHICHVKSDQSEGFRRSCVCVCADPSVWSTDHVQQWLDWAVKEYSLPDVNVCLFHSVDGKRLCKMSRDELQHLTGIYTADVLLSHLHYLRESE